MTPKETTFTRRTVLQAAVDVVRTDGWEALTARAVARRLGASVVPVYSAFGSMKNLLPETLKEIRRLLQEFTSRSYTEAAFLNIGAGLVFFARDEPLLFHALFQARHRFQDIVEDVNASILSWMRTDAYLGSLTEASRARLYDNIGFYTMGLAAAVAAGRVADVSPGRLVRLLKDAGNIAMFAEVAGIADSASPENKRQWIRVLKGKNIPIPDALRPSESRLPKDRLPGSSESAEIPESQPAKTKAGTGRPARRKS